MSQQSAKFIDVTKTFIPADPNAFPETMHGTGREDAPENRIPAAAYEGYNFLPTSYGYKSYFGTNGKLNVDNIPARTDHVILFQTETFENILIALTESGIYVKNGVSAGAWTQLSVVLAPAVANVHYDWSFVVISDVFYAYQAGKATYQKIKSLATAPYYTFENVTPNFLNMAGQVGVFRAGGRLGFWDTADSISWSNQDDYTDFTPSLETLAGNSTFSDVNGRIVTVKPHGPGFMIYASKSIVYIQEAFEATYQWDPAVVLSNSGISYPQDIGVGTPDTRHFAWTDTGLYNIEKAKAEVIVPEVTDYLKESKGPKYPKVLNGRYLFLQMIDKDYIDGLVTFTDEIVTGDPYVFPGGSETLVEATEDFILRGTDICTTLNSMGQAAYPDQQALAGTGGGTVLPGQKPGTKAEPIWTCYISNRAGPPSAITWGATPCPTANLDGIEQNMCPQGDGHKLNKSTTTTEGKTALTGDQVYVDGKWTMGRFIAVQTAIWEKEQAELDAYIAAISNRAFYQQKTSESPACVEANNKSECTIGDYILEYSSPQFGYSACSFWLTRFATKAGTLKVKKTIRKACQYVAAQNQPPTVGPWRYTGTYPPQPTALASCIAAGVGATGFTPLNNCSGTCTAGGGSVGDTFADQSCPAGWSNTGCNCNYPAHYEVADFFAAYNDMEDKDIGDAVPETAYCVISGWKYTKTDNTTATVAANGCAAPKILGSGSNPSILPGSGNDTQPNKGPYPPIGGPNGTICSIPFQPITIPGTIPTVINWPTEVIPFPASSFLLQKGSIAPVYPTFQGALVYDLQLKKWGKYKDIYKLLLDYQPMNDFSGGGIPYSRFGMLAGVMKSGGGLYLFDDVPNDSKITYGKIGYYRLGMTSPEEVRADFRLPFTGQIRLNTSLDGRAIVPSLERVAEFTEERTAVQYGGHSGRWHSITINGRFDLTYLEFRGFIQGKR